MYVIRGTSPHAATCVSLLSSTVNNVDCHKGPEGPGVTLQWVTGWGNAFPCFVCSLPDTSLAIYIIRHFLLPLHAFEECLSQTVTEPHLPDKRQAWVLYQVIHYMRCVHFDQYLISCAVSWLKDGDCCFIHEMQSDGWPYFYPYRRQKQLQWSVSPYNCPSCHQKL